MKEEIKYIIIDALTSGEYKQAKGALCLINKSTNEVEGYCCLGVVTDLYHKIKRKGKWRKDLHGIRTFITPKSGQEWTAMPKEVFEWAGLDDDSGKLPNPIGTRGRPGYGPDLMTLNDELGYSFKRIAEVIFEQL